MRGPIVTRYIQQLLFQTDWGELDYLILDMPPGTGDVQLTITQSIKLTGAVIVTTHHSLSLVDTARGILMFEKVNVPILGVIENMAYFLAPDTGKNIIFLGNKKPGPCPTLWGQDPGGDPDPRRTFQDMSAISQSVYSKSSG